MHKTIKHVLIPFEIFKNKACSRYQLNLIYAKHKYAYKTCTNHAYIEKMLSLYAC